MARLAVGGHLKASAKPSEFIIIPLTLERKPSSVETLGGVESGALVGGHRSPFSKWRVFVDFDHCDVPLVGNFIAVVLRGKK